MDRFTDLLGQLPDDFGDDLLLTMLITCFVILSFFFLSNFLLGIGVRSDSPSLIDGTPSTFMPCSLVLRFWRV